VEKIPQEHRNIRSLTDYFSKFGTVTHVAVDNRGDKALVSFSAHAEAQAAHSSQDAVFGNRFVKVYWHRPQPGKGTIGEQALKDSAATVQALQNGAGNGAAVTGNGNLSRTFAGTSSSNAVHECSSTAGEEDPDAGV
jgi:RNA-binding protein 26